MDIHITMDQHLKVPILVGWTSINPNYFDVNYGREVLREG